MLASSTRPLETDFAGQISKPSLYVMPDQALRASVRGASSSAMATTVIDPRADGAWDRAVASHPNATIFQSSAWANVLCETYGHVPQYLRINSADELATLLPIMEVKSRFTETRGVTVPFSDFCGPLSFGEKTDAPLSIENLKEISRARGWRYFELRAALPAATNTPQWDKFYGHELNLTKSPNELFGRFESSLRRALRKAERSPLAIDLATDAAAMREFYRLHSRTRRRHGIPPQPFAFFQNIQRHIIERGLGFVVVARIGQRPVAGAVFLHFGERALFKFGASDERFQEHRPNNLVMWRGIQQCAAIGLTRLHLGRTDFEHEGLRRFKLAMGAEEKLLSYLRYDFLSHRWMNEKARASSTLPGRIFRRLPLPANQFLGSILYPHLH